MGSPGLQGYVGYNGVTGNVANANTGHKVLFIYICGSSENGAPVNGIFKIILGLLC